jgi:hypothetical protein
MGGAGDLLSLALSVPPWEELHELSPAELRSTHLVTTDLVADVLPGEGATLDVPMAGLVTKPVQDRLPAGLADTAAVSTISKPTKTAEAVPTGGTANAAPAHQQ